MKTINEGRLSNMRRSEKVIMITVLEGDGTAKYPFKEVRYVITMDGEVIGKISRDPWKAIQAQK